MQKYHLVALFVLFFLPLSLRAENKIFKGNDTVIAEKGKNASLSSYLRGTWDVKGNWQVSEGKGKIKKVVKSKIIGVETYAPILNGHYLQKTMDAKIIYYSGETDIKKRENFSELMIMAFNPATESFHLWSYDNTGSFMESEGGYSEGDGFYAFVAETEDLQGAPSETKYTITIQDPNHYQWEVSERLRGGEDWISTASGTSTRRK